MGRAYGDPLDRRVSNYYGGHFRVYRQKPLFEKSANCSSRLGEPHRTFGQFEFDKSEGHVTRFVVQFERSIGDEWSEVVRFDHEPENPMGHDITEEGLHMDVYRDGDKVRVKDDFPPVYLYPTHRDTLSRASERTPTNCSRGLTNGTI